MKPLPTRWESFWIGAVAGFLVGASVAQPAKADERDWVSATVGSYHENRDRGYNEFNYGLGAELALPWEKWRFAGGFYENSYERTTWYALAVREVWSVGNWKLGIAAGGVTGYTSGRVDSVVAPIIAWEGKRFGVNLFPVTPSVIGLQVKMRY